eukprot:Hpha_TRINITY_DN16336_c7_g1::TRINITY_DN16336_c7_g1_i1::g.60688::m.60688
MPNEAGCMDILEPGGWWGEVSSDLPQVATVVSGTWTELLFLGADVWTDLHAQWPECLEPFERMQKARRSRARLLKRELFLTGAESRSDFSGSKAGSPSNIFQGGR